MSDFRADVDDSEARITDSEQGSLTPRPGLPTPTHTPDATPT